MNREIVATVKRLSEIAGITADSNGRFGVYKTGSTPPFTPRRFISSIMNTYEGTDTPTIESTVQNVSMNLSLFNAAVMPMKSPITAPISTDSPPILNDVDTRPFNIVEMGISLANE